MLRMERWGTELWDRWDAVVEQVTAGTQEMATVYARFLNDRARVGVVRLISAHALLGLP